MKTKIISSILLSVIVVLTLVNALPSATSTTPATFTKTVTQSSFILTNTFATPVNFKINNLPLTLTDPKSNSIVITTPQITYNNVASGANTGNIILTYTGDTTNFIVGTYTGNILVTVIDSSNPNNTITMNVPVTFTNTFCKSGDNESTGISISEVNIKNNDGDDTDWKPLDSIDIKVKVDNSGDKVSSVYVELGLIDVNGKNVIGTVENLNNKKISLGSISSDKDKTAEFKFNVPSDFNEEDYKLVVKAYKSGNEATICTSSSSDLDNSIYQTVSGARETDAARQVVVTNIVTSPEETVSCGDKVQISGDVVNIGDTDYSDQFKVTLYNKDLKVNLEQVITQDLNQGDSYNVDFEFDVPQDAAEKSYNLEFRTNYDYDTNDNTYGEQSANKFIKTIKVLGNCQGSTTDNTGTGTTPSTNIPQLKISAELDPETPEAIAGKQVIVRSTLKNTGTTPSSYNIAIVGNTAWSNILSVDPQVVTLAPGESKDVNIVLALDPAAQGDKEFSVRALYGAANDKAIEQKVALTITKGSSSTTSGSTSAIADHFKRNWFIYLIIIVNIVLIVAIIAVIRRMLSSPK